MMVVLAAAQMSDTPLSPAARERAAPAPPDAPREPLVTPAAPPQQLGCSKCRHASRGCGACRPRTGTGGSRGPGSRPGPGTERGRHARRSQSRQREGGGQAIADGAAPAPGPERSGRAGGGPTPGSGRPAEAGPAGAPRRALHAALRLLRQRIMRRRVRSLGCSRRGRTRRLCCVPAPPTGAVLGPRGACCCHPLYAAGQAVLLLTRAATLAGPSARAARRTCRPPWPPCPRAAGGAAQPRPAPPPPPRVPGPAAARPARPVAGHWPGCASW